LPILVPVLSPQQAAREGSPLWEALAGDLDLSVSTLTQLQAVRAAARAQGVVARIHVKVDTGMSRAGAVLEDLPALAREARAAQDAGEVDV
ncbi:Alanine racemase, partial [human gut metagenome]